MRWMSAGVGLGLWRQMARFIFAASRVQLLRPTTATFGRTRMPCKTFSGMSGLCSARPTSSRSSTVMVRWALRW